jgi:capsular polysaccharide biosynthesis protein
VLFVIYNYTFLGKNCKFINIASKQLKRKRINVRKIVYPLGVKIRVNPPSINLRRTSPCQKNKNPAISFDIAQDRNGRAKQYKFLCAALCSPSAAKVD